MEILSHSQAIPFDCCVGRKGGERHWGEKETFKKTTLSVMLSTAPSLRWSRVTQPPLMTQV